MRELNPNRDLTFGKDRRREEIHRLTRDIARELTYNPTPLRTAVRDYREDYNPTED